MPFDTPRLSSAPARFIAALLGFTALTACGSPDEVIDAPATGSSRAALVDLSTGTAIVAHALHGDLSDRATAFIEAMFAEMIATPAAERAQVIAQLDACITNADPMPCAPVLASIGVDFAQIDDDVADARVIAEDVGLLGLPPSDYRAAFRAAAYLHEGIGASSALAGVAVAAGLSCDTDCQEITGNSLGAIEALYLAATAAPPPPQGGGSGGGSGGTGGGSGGTGGGGAGEGGGGGMSAGQVLGIITGVVELLRLIEKAIWNSGEKDKECTEDSECPNGFCHKLGTNDCRAPHAEGHLCTRKAECASNCCKPHISTGFLPSCRPADKCN